MLLSMGRKESDTTELTDGKVNKNHDLKKKKTLITRTYLWSSGQNS